MFFAGDGGADVAVGFEPDEAGDAVFFRETGDAGGLVLGQAGGEVAGDTGVEDAGFAGEDVDVRGAVHEADCGMSG